MAFYACRVTVTRTCQVDVNVSAPDMDTAKDAAVEYMRLREENEQATVVEYNHACYDAYEMPWLPGSVHLDVEV